jgi:3D (Asp-Asp-Asp) domain-containing protein
MTMTKPERIAAAALAGLTAAVALSTVAVLHADEPKTPAPAQVSTTVGVSRDVPDPADQMEVPTPELQSLGTFKLTAYCACPVCCGVWADGLTYTETVATEGRTIAVDPDVIELGSVVYINGHQYVAEDVGGAIQENRIDVFFRDHQAALEFGVQYAEVFTPTTEKGE